MSETSATTTTSFINTSTECISKPPLSSDSSIDSGFSAMTTSDSITANQNSSPASRALSTTMVCNQRRQDCSRVTLSMLPPQPLVPPPPPPLPPPQLQENIYESSNVYDKRASMILQYPNQSTITNGMNNLNIYSDNYYATYAQSSRPLTNNDNSPSRPDKHATTKTHQPNTSHRSHPHEQSSLTQRSSTSSLESASSVPLMPMNVKGMLLHGLPSDEVLRNWLSSIKCEEHIENFMYHGYDMHLVTRMTPQDLASIGCKSPALRKKLLSEIKKLNLEYEIPDYNPSLSLDKWLECLKLSQYHAMLVAENYDSVDKVCKLTWEDLEEIGIVKLGHQKRLLLGIEKVQKSAKQLEENQTDAIYDVHPNHRVSLNGMNTIGRARSGFFQTRAGANLDHRGLPVATVMPALKHVNGTLMQNETNQQQFIAHTNDGVKTNNSYTNNVTNGNTDNEQIYDSSQYGNRMETLKLSDLTSTMKRTAPPLPPVRTNSLKFVQGNGMSIQPIYGNSYGVQENNNIYGAQPTNSTSFLRTPKLATLTATTYKILTSGGHIQTTPDSRNVPIREAPLPPIQQAQLPYQQNLIQATIPEKIDEEPTVDPLNEHHSSGANFPSPPNFDRSNPGLFNVTGSQLADANEFPPPPPSEP